MSGADGWKIERYDLLPESMLPTLRALYERSFEPLRHLAAARHVLTEDEFAEEMAHPAISKYVALNDDGEPVGLTTITNDLTTVTWVSPDFYARRWPEHAATGRVYYLGFTLADPAYQRRGVFDAMISLMAKRMNDEDAVVVWDVCSFNVEQAGLAANIARILSPFSTPPEVVDVQRYYASDFGRASTGGPR